MKTAQGYSFFTLMVHAQTHTNNRKFYSISLDFKKRPLSNSSNEERILEVEKNYTNTCSQSDKNE